MGGGGGRGKGSKQAQHFVWQLTLHTTIMHQHTKPGHVMFSIPEETKCKAFFKIVNPCYDWLSHGNPNRSRYCWAYKVWLHKVQQFRLCRAVTLRWAFEFKPGSYMTLKIATKTFNKPPSKVLLQKLKHLLYKGKHLIQELQPYNSDLVDSSPLFTSPSVKRIYKKAYQVWHKTILFLQKIVE